MICNGKLRAEWPARDWDSHLKCFEEIISPLKCFKEIFGEAVHISQSGIVRDSAHESEGLRRHFIVNIISHSLNSRFGTKKEIMP